MTDIRGFFRHGVAPRLRVMDSDYESLYSLFTTTLHSKRRAKTLSDRAEWDRVGCGSDLVTVRCTHAFRASVMADTFRQMNATCVLAHGYCCAKTGGVG